MKIDEAGILSAGGETMDAAVSAERQEKRMAFLNKLKEIFRDFRRQPAGKAIAKINPILRGWVTCFAIGCSSRCFSFIGHSAEMKIRRYPGRARQRRGLRLEAVEPGMAVWNVGTLIGALRFLCAAALGSRSGLMGPHNSALDVKCAAVRKAGNPHAMCDEAGLETGSRFGQ